MIQHFPFFARLKRKVGPFCIGFFVFFQVLNAETGIEIKKDLVYATKDKLDLKLDAYLPAGSKLRPSVLVIHGGGWRFGSKRQLAKYASRLAEGFQCLCNQLPVGPQTQAPRADRGSVGMPFAGSKKTVFDMVVIRTESVRWVIRREPIWHACLR